MTRGDERKVAELKRKHSILTLAKKLEIMIAEIKKGKLVRLDSGQFLSYSEYLNAYF